MRDRFKLRACDAHLCDKLPAQREAGGRRLEGNGRPRDGCPHIPKGKRSEEHTSELQSRLHLVCRLLLEKKNMVDPGGGMARPDVAGRKREWLFVNPYNRGFGLIDVAAT